MRIASIKLVLPLLVAFSLLDTTFVRAEQQAEGDAEDANDADQDADADADAAADEYQEEEQSGYSMMVCSDSAIVVQDMSILCNTPGTYYYGSSMYRNSESCQPGDKAKVTVDFYVQDANEIYEAGGIVYITLLGESFSVPGDQLIYEHASLCDLGTYASLDGAECPGNGKYRVSTQFMWGGQTDDDDAAVSSFVPQLMVGFKSNMENNEFDLGGANTDLCKGNYFANWKEGVRQTYSGALGKFIATFGILLFTASILMCVVWCMVFRCNPEAEESATGLKATGMKAVRKLTGRKQKEPEEKQKVWDDEFMKVKMLGEKDVLDF